MSFKALLLVAPASRLFHPSHVCVFCSLRSFAHGSAELRRRASPSPRGDTATVQASERNAAAETVPFRPPAVGKREDVSASPASAEGGALRAQRSGRSATRVSAKGCLTTAATPPPLKMESRRRRRRGKRPLRAGEERGGGVVRRDQDSVSAQREEPTAARLETAVKGGARRASPGGEPPQRAASFLREVEAGSSSEGEGSRFPSLQVSPSSGGVAYSSAALSAQSPGPLSPCDCCLQGLEEDAAQSRIQEKRLLQQVQTLASELMLRLAVQQVEAKALSQVALSPTPSSACLSDLRKSLACFRPAKSLSPPGAQTPPTTDPTSPESPSPPETLSGRRAPPLDAPPTNGASLWRGQTTNPAALLPAFLTPPPLPRQLLLPALRSAPLFVSEPPQRDDRPQNPLPQKTDSPRAPRRSAAASALNPAAASYVPVALREAVPLHSPQIQTTGHFPRRRRRRHRKNDDSRRATGNRAAGQGEAKNTADACCASLLLSAASLRLSNPQALR